MGKRRRALVRDQLIHVSHVAPDWLRGVAPQVHDRAYAMVMDLRYQLDRTPPSDEVLAARLRAKLGRIVSHMSALEVSVYKGQVTLSGPILEDEVDHALMAARLVSGVTGVNSQLQVHAPPDGVPALREPQQASDGLDHARGRCTGSRARASRPHR
jgi:hypothetical protein